MSNCIKELFEYYNIQDDIDIHDRYKIVGMNGFVYINIHKQNGSTITKSLIDNNTNIETINYNTLSNNEKNELYEKLFTLTDWSNYFIANFLNIDTTTVFVRRKKYKINHE